MSAVVHVSFGEARLAIPCEVGETVAVPSSLFVTRRSAVNGADSQLSPPPSVDPEAAVIDLVQDAIDDEGFGAAIMGAASILLAIAVHERGETDLVAATDPFMAEVEKHIGWLEVERPAPPDGAA